VAIHDLSSVELQRLVRAIARADFTEPVSRGGLVLAKFGHLESELDALVGHSKRAALAIIAAILREREKAPAGRSTAVWSGPPPSGQGTRAPYDLLVELIATAGESVLFTGVDLQRDARLLRSLHAAQRGRSLQVVVVLAEPQLALAQQAEELFATFRPWPELYAPEPARLRSVLPLCLLTDRTRGVVLAGAPPEVEAPDEHVTAGILIDDPASITALYAQWQLLIDTGALTPLQAAEPTSS
jgi:hypothetical protein